MMTNTKKAKERITDTFALLDCVGADVAIVNADTGETIKLDSTALFAGLQAGLVLAAAIIEEPKLTEQRQMAAVTFQIWLGDTYGLWLTALCIVVDAAVIVWLVKRYA